MEPRWKRERRRKELTCLFSVISEFPDHTSLVRLFLECRGEAKRQSGMGLRPREREREKSTTPNSESPKSY